MKFKRTWTLCLHSWELLGQPGNAGPLALTFTANTTYEPCLTLPCPSHVLTSLLPHLQFHGQALKLFPSLCHRLCFKGFQKPKRNCIFTLDKLEYSNPYVNCLCFWLSIVIHCGDAAYFTNYLLRRIWGGGPPLWPVVKNLLGNAGDLSSIPDWGTKIPHATEQLSQWATATEPVP